MHWCRILALHEGDLSYWPVDFESNFLIVLALAETKATATISSS